MPTQVFTRRSVKMELATKVALWLCLVATLLIGWQLYHLFPAQMWQRAAAEAFAKGISHPSPTWLELAMGLASLGVLWVQWKQQRSARLLLDEHWLRLDSGVPILRRWLDWSLSLDNVRSGQTPLRLNGMAIGSNALWMFRVGWGLSGLRRFQPAAWMLQATHRAPQDPTNPTWSADENLPPHRPLGYVHWGDKDNTAWLQQRFDVLPLVVALRQQGIHLPPLNGPQATQAGVDLLRYSGLSTALKLVLPAALVLGAALQHVARHQHYFSPWSLPVWVAIALSMAALTGTWLWRDKPATGMQRGERWSVPMAQGLVAMLVGVVVPWGLQAAPLVLGKWVLTPQSVDFVLDHDHQRLVPEPGALVATSIPLDDVDDFWATQDNGSLQRLPVYIGPFGLWQQYDVEALNARIAEFIGQTKEVRRPSPFARKTNT